jgi:hypothetical protein
MITSPFAEFEHPATEYVFRGQDQLAQNTPMLAVVRKLHFKIEPVSGDATVLRIRRALQRLRR